MMTPEERRAKQREYVRQQRLNPERRAEINERNRLYAAAKRNDPEWLAAQRDRNRLYEAEHREQASERHRRWRLANPEQPRALQAKYRASEFGKEQRHRRDAMRRNPNIRHEYERVEVFKRDNWTCVGCGKQLDEKTVTIDHIIPLSKAEAGFVYTEDDVQTMCQPCNASKGAR